MSSLREFNNTVFISIDTELVVPLAHSYQLPTWFFTRSKKTADSTPSCAWTSLLLRNISSRILLNLFFCVPTMLIVAVLVDARVCNPVMDPNWWHHFNVVWFIVVFQNLGFGDSSYIILSRTRAISWLEFFVAVFSYVENAPTCSRNLVFLRSLSCQVDNKILMFLTKAKNRLTSAWSFQQL